MSPDIPQMTPEASPEPSAAPAPDFYAQLLILKAEFENYRKRVDRERPEYFRTGKADMISRLLPIYDLLLQAHQQVLAAHEDTPLAKGMEGIFKEFEKIFKEEGVTVMEPLGRPFDAYRHEVLGTAEASEAEEGVVVEILQNGFMLGERVLRTAKVRIAQKK